MGAPGQYRHLQSIPRRNAAGERYFTHYHRKTKVRLYAEPGTPAFDLEYEAACQGQVLRNLRPRWVYFVQSASTGLIKIGKAVQPQTRLVELQCGSADELRLLGVIRDPRAGRMEGELHRMFAPLRQRGEWFEPGAALLAFIEWRAVPYEGERSADAVTVGAL